jgi:hypothetical protein
LGIGFWKLIQGSFRKAATTWERASEKWRPKNQLAIQESGAANLIMTSADEDTKEIL